MKTFDAHQTFENQTTKVEINYLTGFVKVTDKEENTSKIIKPETIHGAIKHYTKHFSEETARGNAEIRH